MSARRYESLSNFYSSKERYLFLGNGINQLNHAAISWTKLLDNIKRQAGVDVELDPKKSNTLLFEEIAFKMNNGGGTVEDSIQRLKEILAENAIGLMPHPVIQNLVKSNIYAHYLTTNYDYCIERCIDPSYDGSTFKSKLFPKYSLFRFNEIGGVKVWHIHGECNNGYKGSIEYKEKSILIGFEHYSDYLEKVHSLVKDNKGRGLADLIRDNKENWVHLFYTRDIDIMGFGMDYNETHLWFLLNFRARLKRKTSLRNRIRWILPEFALDRQKDKIQVLKALDVEVIPVTAANGDYEGFYREFTNSH